MRETLVKTEDFKDSLLGKIPKEWEVCPIEAKLERIIDYRGKTPEKTTSGIPLITAKNVREGYLDPEPCEYIHENDYDHWMTRGFPNPGDVLFTTEAPLGNVARVPSYKLALAQRLLTLCVNPNELDAGYLFWVLNWLDSRQRLEQKSTGSTVLGIKQSVFRKILFRFPPLPEQQYIAEILNTVDEAIAHTSSLIAKLKQMKAGLLHDLLTRGLDENGELRNAIAHPEQFKDSPLGRIPKDWKIYNTGAIATIKYGINDAVDQTLESGVLTITLPCVSKTGELTLDKELLALSARHKVRDEDILQAGDLLFNWRNGSQEHLGKTAYFEATGEYTHIGFLLRIRVNPELCDSRYLWWQISYMKSEGFFLRAKSQVNNTFNSEELANMRVIVPPIPEQQRIVKALEPCEQRIRAEEAYRDKLKLQKQGLMHDLLTGKVRVNDIYKPASVGNSVQLTV